MVWPVDVANSSALLVAVSEGVGKDEVGRSDEEGKGPNEAYASHHHPPAQVALQWLQDVDVPGVVVKDWLLVWLL